MSVVATCCDNLRLILENDLEYMALSAEPPMAEHLPETNILTAWRSRVARSVHNDAVISTQVILGNSPDKALVADGFALSHHNLRGADTYRLELFAGENQTGEVAFDSGDQSAAVLIPMGVWVAGVNFFGETYADDLDPVSAVWFTAVAYRSFRLTLTSYGSDDGFVQVGMVYLGKSISPDYNFAWGSELSWDDGSSFVRTEGGSLLTEGARDLHRVLELVLENMTDNDRQFLSGKLRKAAGKPILVSAHPGACDQIRQAEYTMVAKMDISEPWRELHVDWHARNFRFIEV